MKRSIEPIREAPIAIIPARGGSKRIPRKNIREFLGKPIIAYPIQAALDSGLFSRVIVSTDDAEIAEISKEFGAEVPFMRSAANSSDAAPIIEVLLEVLDGLGTKDAIVCCMFPTSVFATAKFLQESYLDFKGSDFSTAACITEYEHPIQRALAFKPGAVSTAVEFRWPENRLRMTNSLEKHYHDVGLLYWARSDRLREDRNIFTSLTQGIIVDRLACQDIDHESDWNLAELKYKAILAKNLEGNASGTKHDGN